MRKAKRKRLSSKCQKRRTHLRGPGENHQQPEEDELSLYGGSDLDDQIDRLVDTLYYSDCQRKGGRISEKGEDSDDDDLIKDIENGFNLAEQTGEPIGSNLAK